MPDTIKLYDGIIKRKRDQLAERIWKNRQVLKKNGHWSASDRNRALSRIRAMQKKTRHLVNLLEAERKARDDHERWKARHRDQGSLPPWALLAMGQMLSPR